MPKPVHLIRRIKSRLLDPLMGTITRVRTKEAVIALTFDDGPHPLYTVMVLDQLRDHGAKATFFVVGQAAEDHPVLIERIRAEGHALANHTYSHVRMPMIGGRERRKEVRACDRLIGQAQPKLFRPPWGVQTRASRFDLLRLGYRVVTWDVVVEDWLRQEPEDLAGRIVGQAGPGSIVLLHDAVRPAGPDSDSCTDRDYLIRALEIALPRLARDFRLVTMPTMLKMGRPEYRAWCYDPAE